jgi:hypothetical protein
MAGRGHAAPRPSLLISPLLRAVGRARALGAGGGVCCCADSAMRFVVRPCSGDRGRRKREEERRGEVGRWWGMAWRNRTRGGGLVSCGCRGDGRARATRAAGGRSGWQSARRGWFFPPFGRREVVGGGGRRGGRKGWRPPVCSTVAWRVRCGGQERERAKRARAAFAALALLQKKKPTKAQCFLARCFLLPVGDLSFLRWPLQLWRIAFRLILL